MSTPEYRWAVKNTTKEIAARGTKVCTSCEHSHLDHSWVTGYCLECDCTWGVGTKIGFREIAIDTTEHRRVSRDEFLEFIRSPLALFFLGWILICVIFLVIDLAT